MFDSDSDKWDVIAVHKKTKEVLGYIQPHWKDCLTFEALALVKGFNSTAKKEGLQVRASIVRAGTPVTGTKAYEAGRLARRQGAYRYVCVATDQERADYYRGWDHEDFEQRQQVVGS